MNTTVTLDEAGRVVIPQQLRDEFRLGVGDTLALESDGRRIILRPVQPIGSMREERGVWVFRTGQKLSADLVEETLDRIRQGRDAPTEDKAS